MGMFSFTSWLEVKSLIIALMFLIYFLYFIFSQKKGLELKLCESEATKTAKQLDMKGYECFARQFFIYFSSLVFL